MLTVGERLMQLCHCASLYNTCHIHFFVVSFEGLQDNESKKDTDADNDEVKAILKEIREEIEKKVFVNFSFFLMSVKLFL